MCISVGGWVYCRRFIIIFCEKKITIIILLLRSYLPNRLARGLGLVAEQKTRTPIYSYIPCNIIHLHVWRIPLILYRNHCIYTYLVIYNIWVRSSAVDFCLCYRRRDITRRRAIGSSALYRRSRSSAPRYNITLYYMLKCYYRYSRNIILTTYTHMTYTHTHTYIL